jgi:hypothetical protein
MIETTTKQTNLLLLFFFFVQMGRSEDMVDFSLSRYEEPEKRSLGDKNLLDCLSNMLIDGSLHNPNLDDYLDLLSDFFNADAIRDIVFKTCLVLAMNSPSQASSLMDEHVKKINYSLEDDKKVRTFRTFR